MMNKFTAVTVALSGVFIALTACGTDNGNPTGNYRSPAEIQAILQDTDYECESWTARSDTFGVCDMGVNGEQEVRTEVGVASSSALGEFSAWNRTRTLAVIVGDDWYFTCSNNLGRAGCTGLRDKLGGEFMMPDGSLGDHIF
ncbi:hypothetical protein [Corynebacterium variabile]|uniref:hypothetical protein n=1 Tax=Corynebacterium variabile TaxID=1727 RepID=UPI0028A1EC98|nr:hypothetical protein [Corynebacterium variabile]